MMQDRLGVLITYYNERNLLHECLSSLLGQKTRPSEIIVYDDASTHPAEEYIPAGVRIPVIRGDVNRGPACGRNALLRASRSDYVHFHDADDLFDPRWCKSVANIIQGSAPDAIFTEISSYKDGQLGSDRMLGLKRLLNGEDLVRFCIRGAMLPAAGTYRRQRVLAIGGYREQLWQSEDFDFHVRLAASGIRYTVIDDPLVAIRIRSCSRSQNHEEVWSSALEAIRLLAKEIDPHYRSDLAYKAARAGSILFRAGARQKARVAFRIAQELGPPSYYGERPLYGFIARLFGPQAAESFGLIYRRFVSESGRRYLAERGW